MQLDGQMPAIRLISRLSAFINQQIYWLSVANRARVKADNVEFLSQDVIDTSNSYDRHV